MSSKAGTERYVLQKRLTTLQDRLPLTTIGIHFTSKF